MRNVRILTLPQALLPPLLHEVVEEKGEEKSIKRMGSDSFHPWW
jgi:hypothetical protein